MTKTSYKEIFSAQTIPETINGQSKEIKQKCN